MRFRLTVETTSKNRIIPVNYQYELSAWIYKTIHFGDAGFADWLHKHGYTDGKKQFKLFTFSNLSFGKYKVSGDRLEILSEPIELNLNFYTNQAAEPFITGLFRNQEFTLGDKLSQVNLNVKSIEKLPEPEWHSTMRLRTESPVVISIRETPESKSALYLSPESDNYEEYFLKNLTSKFMAFMNNHAGSSQVINFGKNEEPRFRLLGKPHQKVIKIKANSAAETKIKGFMYEFEFTAPVELMKLGYYSGFGEKNSLGFGCCRIIGPTSKNT